ncbi:MAG: lasso peptide biosynthesis B2 protein [Egibacteraceae bacterium]
MRVNPRVHAVTDEAGCLVLLNEESGQWHALNAMGALCWRELARTGDVDAVVASVASRYPEVTGEQVRADLTHLAGQLLRRGLLTLAAVGPAEGGKAMAVAPRANRRVSPVDRLAALVAFPIAVAVLRLGFGRATRLVALLRRLPARPASLGEAQAAVAAAALVARWYPGRAACLERSLTAVLSAAVRRRRLDWCLGTANDPRRFHAWVEADGRPVTAPDDEPVEPDCRRVLTV